MMGRVSLVAHRGQPLTFPENSLQGFEHVLDAGARYVETDVHITADGIPVLSHDANLLKLTGKQLIVSDYQYDVIKELSAGFPERFGDQFTDFRIATLAQFAELIARYPDVTAFIEIKKSAISYFGDKAIGLILQDLETIAAQAVIISFEYEALQLVKQQSSIPVGWVLPDWQAEHQQKLKELEPQYVFVDTDFCPTEQGDLWAGPWQWAAYTINDAEQINVLSGIGIELLETDRYTDIIKESDKVEVSNDF